MTDRLQNEELLYGIAKSWIGDVGQHFCIPVSALF